ncbi:MAG: hypothetical protein HKP12_16215, partial [Gammaproteobacteria bacterium]|nr:hypothetical protein [Gammaproteobacteria bacterium]
TDPRSGKQMRHHVDKSTFRKALAAAVKKLNINKRVSPHVLRHYVPFLTMSGNVKNSAEML